MPSLPLQSSDPIPLDARIPREPLPEPFRDELRGPLPPPRRGRAASPFRWYLPFTAFLGGCSSNTAPTQGWLGTWTETGDQSVTCSGKTDHSALGGTLSITQAASNNDFELSDGSCDLSWAVSADSAASATLTPGQKCAASVDGATDTVTFTQGSATLDGDTITFTTVGSASGGCSVAQNASLARDIPIPKMR